MTNRSRRSQAQWQHLIGQHYRTTNSSWFKRRRILQATETVPSILLSLSEHCVKDYLCGYQGYFQVDGYAGDDKTDAILVGCFAPARRKFIEAQKIQLKDQRSKVKDQTGKADWTVNHIQKRHRVNPSIKCHPNPPSAKPSGTACDNDRIRYIDL